MKKKVKNSKKSFSPTISVFLILGITFSLLSLAPEGRMYFPIGITFLVIGIADIFGSKKEKGK
jgi:hypothetical protein